MDSNVFHNVVDFHQWNRKILNSYWVVFASTSFAFAVICVFTRDPGAALWPSFLKLCLLPSLAIAAVLAVTEITLRSGSNLRHYFMMFAGTSFSIVIVNTLPNVHGVEMVFLPPLFASLAYYDVRKVAFSFLINTGFFLLLWFIHPVLHARIGLSELLVTVFSLFNGVLIILSLMKRGVSLHRALLKATQHKQELLIQKDLMEKLSKIDALTELYNHKTFHEHLARCLEQPDASGKPVHLALLDIDNFKTINDTYGHWAGDQVLKRVASVIRANMTDDDFAFRYGGEEFAVLFTCKSLNESHALLERIRKEVSEIGHEELNDGTVSVSIGLQTLKPQMGRERFFKAADSCLYEAKRAGKNRIVMNGEPPEIRSDPVVS